jgi:photosystem II stability/assembly factor-like uncharacterized protein
MSNADDEIIASLRELVAQQSVPPLGWEDDLIRKISEHPPKSSTATARSPRGRQEHKRWRPALAEVGAALAIAAVVVVGIQVVFHHPSSTGTASPSPSHSPQSTQPSPSPSATLSAPTGFQPKSLTAISESDFWVLGASGCTASGCASEILHTIDGGRSFQAIHVPPSYFLAGNEPTPGPPTVTDIRFADESNGWVFGDTLWATHDAGATWSQLTFGNHLLDVAQLEPGANGYVYAVFEMCTDPTTAVGCTYPVMRSQANTDTWSVVSPPGDPVGRPSIGVHGDTLWVMYFDRSTGLEWRSSDDGLLWERGAMPCEPDLGGVFDPVSTSVIWAFCATGTAGGPAVSTDGGAAWSYQPAANGLFTNSGFVAALSAQHAFVGGGGGGMFVTDDGGQTYQQIPELAGAGWAGFTDSEVGYVLTQDQNTDVSQLWRTTNAGATWTVVALP